MAFVLYELSKKENRNYPAVMGMSKCYALMKCSLIFLGVVFSATGASVCGVCAWALFSGEGEGSARAGLALLAAWGAALAVGAAAAVLGAARRSGSLLAGAFAVLALAAVAESAAAVWAVRHEPRLRAELRAGLMRAVHAHYGTQHPHHEILDALQQGLQCCGAEGPRDWQSSSWWERRSEAIDLSVSAAPAHFRVPRSCCVTECTAAPQVPVTGSSDAVWEGGCAERVLEALEGASRPVLVVAAATLGAHVLTLGLCLALCLCVDSHGRYKA